MHSGARYLVILSALLLAGCLSPRTVDFSNRVDLHGPGNTTRVYLDVNGNKYPADGVPAGGFHLREHGGSLLNAMRDSASGACTGARGETAILCDAAHAAACDDRGWCALQDWHAKQASLWQAAAARIAARKPSTLVILIHGFNNTAAESSPNFDKAKLAIMDAAADPKSLHFVEVYWDGCSTNEYGVGCWSKAQGTGPLVGLALRPLVNALTSLSPASGSQPTVRVLTHSSGAFVAASIFGNPVGALKLLKEPRKNPRYERFAKLATAQEGYWRVPQPAGLRVGMLAAATAPVILTGTGQPGEGWLARGAELMLAIHPADSALTKKIGICRHLGYSCLGARFEEDYCFLVNSQSLAKRKVRLRAYDFERADWPWGEDRTAHNFGIYVVQAAEQTSFIRDLIDPGQPAPAPGRFSNEKCPRPPGAPVA